MVLGVDRISRQLKLLGEEIVEYQTTFAVQLADILRKRIFMFSAERLNVGQHRIGRTLNSNRMPETWLKSYYFHSSDPKRFDQYSNLVRMIFPEITQITIPPVSESEVRILVWSIDPQSSREDLAMELSESGTGIGQVLAMLYIVVTAPYPRTIIIDEPQSFLHPGAIRKLFGIFKNYPQHQYVVTTHSPTVITAADPGRILLVRMDGCRKPCGSC
jgi:hypothetical protein